MITFILMVRMLIKRSVYSVYQLLTYLMIRQVSMHLHRMLVICPTLKRSVWVPEHVILLLLILHYYVKLTRASTIWKITPGVSKNR